MHQLNCPISRHWQIIRYYAMPTALCSQVPENPVLTDMLKRAHSLPSAQFFYLGQNLLPYIYSVQYTSPGSEISLGVKKYCTGQN